MQPHVLSVIPNKMNYIIWFIWHVIFISYIPVVVVADTSLVVNCCGQHEPAILHPIYMLIFSVYINMLGDWTSRASVPHQIR